MSTIETLLHNIEVAKHGEDVRGSIHDAIERCYNDVHSPTLNTEALEAAIQTKIDEGEMAALTIGDGTITTAKIANGAITQAKLDPNISFEADAVLDETSTNAIQNKAVASAISELNGSLANLSGFNQNTWSILLEVLSAGVYDESVRDDITRLINALGNSYTKTAATSISLSRNQLTLTSSDTVTLALTVAPDNANEPIVWESSNSDVVLVRGFGRTAEAVPVGNGNATITVACGSRSATCTVSCSLPFRHRITRDYNKVTSNKSNAFADDGATYTETLTANTGFDLGTVTVTMNGTDITSTAYNPDTGVITIASVTGKIAITADVTPRAATYGLHFVESFTPTVTIMNANTALVKDMDTVELTIDLPAQSISTNKVIVRGTNWFGAAYPATNTWASNLFGGTPNLTPNEVYGKGKVTITIPNTSNDSGWLKFGWISGNQMNPEMTFYNLKGYKNGVLIYDCSPTNVLGQLKDKVSGVTFTANSTTGLSLVEE